MENQHPVPTDQPIVTTPPADINPVVNPQEVVPAQTEAPQIPLSPEKKENVDKIESLEKPWMKWKTVEERVLACEAYCEYLRKGRSKRYYPPADENTINRYIKDFPEQFRPEKIVEAERAGLAYIESIGFKGAIGQLKGFNPAAWIFITKNKLGWRDKQDVTTNDKDLPTPILGGSYVHPNNSDEETTTTE